MLDQIIEVVGTVIAGEAGDPPITDEEILDLTTDVSDLPIDDYDELSAPAAAAVPVAPEWRPARHRPALRAVASQPGDGDQPYPPAAELIVVDVAARPAGPDDLEVVSALCEAGVAELRPHRGGEIWSQWEARPPPIEPALAELFDDEAAALLVGTDRRRRGRLRRRRAPPAPR